MKPKSPHTIGERQRTITSELSGFYRLPLVQRRRRIAEITELSEEDMLILSGEEGLYADQADHMVENVIGVVSLPFALCVNLRIDDRDWLVPMAIEEASVVAAASHAAKLLRSGGGIHTTVSPAHMIGQIQLLDVPEPAAAERAIRQARDELLQAANTCDPNLIEAGGGAVDVEVRHLSPNPTGDPLGPMLVVHLVVDVRDAMGANTVNSMCEHVAPRLQQLTAGSTRLRIISNLADRRTVVASGTVLLPALEGKGCSSAEDLARGIEEASVFAERDPYRAATHNKGIMNGVDGVLLAFGQDWRAVEAGAHSFASRSGRYSALARWRVTDQGLTGRLELPVPVGVVGGVTGVHPTFQVACRLSGVCSAAELASLTAAVGLAQNLGALRALAAEGIQKGHMRVHARNVAVAAGAMNSEIDKVARTISEQKSVSVDGARRTLKKLRIHSLAERDLDQIRQRFNVLRETYLPQIIELFDQVLDEATPDGSTLGGMCRYHLESGGKRLRAVLPLLVGETLGGDPAQLVPFGAACEMLHNATLVHDDLQDGDRLRRGHETIWHRFGTPQAINLGDAMFYYTLLLVQQLNVPHLRREAAGRRVIHETLRVIDGQEREFLLKQADKPSLADYFAMVEGKTSGLFALPMAGAAVLCAAPHPVVDGLQEAARHMGVLFQIQDDVLDLYGEKGRETRGSDVQEGKRSILVIHALNNAPAEEASWLKEVLDRDRDKTTPQEIDETMVMLKRTGSLDFALEEIARRKELATSLSALEDNQHLQSLIAAMCELFLEPIRRVLARR